MRRSLVPLYGAGVGAGAWSALLQIVATPVYLRLLGVEGYGLIGFYTTLQAVLQALDLGFGVTIGREIARLSAAREGAELRDLVRTFEVAYWTVALLVGSALIAASPILGRRWFHDAHLDERELGRALTIMAFLWAAQWLTSFYQSALIGLERIVAFNFLKIAATTVMHGGAILWLATVSATPSALFAFQAVVCALHAVAVGALTMRALPASLSPTRARLALIISRRRFAAGMAGITVCGTLLVQSDKVIVSRMLPLREFGYYSLSWIVAASLFIGAVPLFQALLPRFSALAATGAMDAALEVYRAAIQGVTVLAVAPSCVVAFLAADILLVWTGNAEVARSAAPIVTILAIGSALNAIMTPPYALQLATGHTRFAFSVAFAQLVLFVPLVIVLAGLYGAVGAAVVWPVIQVGYVAVAVPFTQRKLLHAGMGQWIRDVVPPSLAAVVMAALISLVPLSGASRLVRFLYLIAAAAATLAASIAAAPRVRNAVLEYARRLVRA